VIVQNVPTTMVHTEHNINILSLSPSCDELTYRRSHVRLFHNIQPPHFFTFHSY